MGWVHFSIWNGFAYQGVLDMLGNKVVMTHLKNIFVFSLPVFLFALVNPGCYPDRDMGTHVCDTCRPCEECIEKDGEAVCEPMASVAQRCDDDGVIHSFNSCDEDEGVAENCGGAPKRCVAISDRKAECQCLPHYKSQDCLECEGNWDLSQGCEVCRTHWVDDDNDCGTCPQHWDAAADCSACVGNWSEELDCFACMSGWDVAEDCEQCLPHFDTKTDCLTCLGNRDLAANCTTCIDHWVDEGNDCGTCPGNWDEDQDCASCRNRWEGDDCEACPDHFDAQSDCVECRNHWEGDNCDVCPGNWDSEQDCGVCRNQWTGANCEVCPGNWDANSDCSACRNHWEGENCEVCPGNWDPDHECGICRNQWQGEDCLNCPGNWDPQKDCGYCKGNWSELTACISCRNHWENNGDECQTCPQNWDAKKDCAACLGNYNLADGCRTCRNSWINLNDFCGTCPANWDASQDCKTCLGNWNFAVECSVCINAWQDQANECGTCPPNWDANQNCAACQENWDINKNCTECVTGWHGAGCNVCRYYVKANASSLLKDGNSWNTAFLTIQEGLDAAAVALEDKPEAICDVWVASGKYTPYISSEYDKIQLRERVRLFGGFNGGEQSPEERDFSFGLSDLWGQLLVRTVVVGEPNSYIDGFYIHGGKSLLSIGGSDGGGIRQYGGDLTVKNCRISGNSAINGAGIVFGFGKLLIDNVLIDHNQAYAKGQAIYITYQADVTVLNSTIVKNTYHYDSKGAIYSESNGAFVRNTILYSNKMPNLDGYKAPAYNVASSIIEGGAYWGATVYDVDPQFVDYSNFHLTAGSPGIGAADSIYSSIRDLDGKVRDARPDIGVYEF